MNEINFLPEAVVQELEKAGLPQDSLIFCRNNRWIYQIPQTLPNNNQLPYQPIDSLGPFGKYLNYI